MSGHTPGPWVAEDRDDRFVILADHEEIAALEVEDLARACVVEANAELIAAAPDLLAALKAVGCRYMGLEHTSSDGCSGNAEKSGIRDTAQWCVVCAAIAKAEGRQP